MAAATVLDAYTAGYALIDAPDTLPLPRSAWLDILTLDDTLTVEEVLNRGTLTAARTALHRARLRLYSQHRVKVVAAARQALNGLSVPALTAQLILLANQPRAVRRDQAYSTLRSAAYGLTGQSATWQQANDDAASAATERGRAEAMATPTGGGTPDPKKVGAILAAGIGIGAVTATGWQDRQLARQAWILSATHPENADTPTAPVQAALDDLDGVGDQAEDDMHATMSGAFVDYFDQGDGTTLGQYAWVTEDDDLVCPDCDDNESNGPYSIGDLPDMPAHPNCRCWFELA
jgi:hypothetical protein